MSEANAVAHAQPPAERPLPDRMRDFRDRGWLTGHAFADRREELSAVRDVARRGVGAARVFDGHRNGLERLIRHRPQDVPDELQARAAAGDAVLGVWGADPGPGEGHAAELSTEGTTITGVKVFCSGAGAVDQAIVLVRRAPGAPPTLPVLVAVQESESVHIDRDWFTAPALAESQSHRVEFSSAPVLAILGSNGTLSEEPWMSGDALRSTAVWAGAADTILARILATPAGGADASERLGRATAILASVDAWLEAGLAAVERAHRGGPSPWPAVAAMRLELTERLRDLLRLAAEHGGSRVLVHDPEMYESRNALDLLLLQHRLSGAARRLGEEAASAAARDD